MPFDFHENGPLVVNPGQTFPSIRECALFEEFVTEHSAKILEHGVYFGKETTELEHMFMYLVILNTCSERNFFKIYTSNENPRSYKFKICFLFETTGFDPYDYGELEKIQKYLVDSFPFLNVYNFVSFGGNPEKCVSISTLDVNRKFKNSLGKLSYAPEWIILPETHHRYKFHSEASTAGKFKELASNRILGDDPEDTEFNFEFISLETIKNLAAFMHHFEGDYITVIFRFNKRIENFCYEVAFIYAMIACGKKFKIIDIIINSEDGYTVNAYKYEKIFKIIRQLVNMLTAVQTSAKYSFTSSVNKQTFDHFVVPYYDVLNEMTNVKFYIEEYPDLIRHRLYDILKRIMLESRKLKKIVLVDERTQKPPVDFIRFFNEIYKNIPSTVSFEYTDSWLFRKSIFSNERMFHLTPELATHIKNILDVMIGCFKECYRYGQFKIFKMNTFLTRDIGAYMRLYEIFLLPLSQITDFQEANKFIRDFQEKNVPALDEHLLVFPNQDSYNKRKDGFLFAAGIYIQGRFDNPFRYLSEAMLGLYNSLNNANTPGEYRLFEKHHQFIQLYFSVYHNAVSGEKLIPDLADKLSEYISNLSDMNLDTKEFSSGVLCELHMVVATTPQEKYDYAIQFGRRPTQ